MTLRDLGLTKEWFGFIQQQRDATADICAMAFLLRLVIFPLAPGQWWVYTSLRWPKIDARHDNPLAAICMVCEKLLETVGEDWEVPQDA